MIYRLEGTVFQGRLERSKACVNYLPIAATTADKGAHNERMSPQKFGQYMALENDIQSPHRLNPSVDSRRTPSIAILIPISSTIAPLFLLLLSRVGAVGLTANCKQPVRFKVSSLLLILSRVRAVGLRGDGEQAVRFEVGSLLFTLYGVRAVGLAGNGEHRVGFEVGSLLFILYGVGAVGLTGNGEQAVRFEIYCTQSALTSFYILETIMKGSQRYVLAGRAAGAARVRVAKEAVMRSSRRMLSDYMELCM